MLLRRNARWRGENVATSEVEAVISNVINLKDAVVYGVQVNDALHTLLSIGKRKREIEINFRQWTVVST